MTTVNVHEAKARLSELLNLLEQGETVVICRRNKPIAELRPYRDRGRSRPIGLCPEFPPLTEAFFEPLPDEWLEAFH
ncbi:type II toxin-antitoxin system prevent-host-death family antitoxin [bacterium CPR1]|nr:type II toxin-antitoxin system prevent-host-death family antitoxin [bacterium CPR1]